MKLNGQLTGARSGYAGHQVEIFIPALISAETGARILAPTFVRVPVSDDGKFSFDVKSGLTLSSPMEVAVRAPPASASPSCRSQRFPTSPSRYFRIPQCRWHRKRPPPILRLDLSRRASTSMTRRNRIAPQTSWCRSGAFTPSPEEPSPFRMCWAPRMPTPEGLQLSRSRARRGGPWKSRCRDIAGRTSDSR